MNTLSRWLILFLFLHSSAYAANVNLTPYLDERYKDINGIIILINPQTGKNIAVVDPQSLISKRFPPGSLIKPFLVISALKEKGWKPDKVVYCSKDVCWYLAGHKQLNLIQAISYSCNRYFQEVAREVNCERFLDTIQEFGLITEKASYLNPTAKERVNLMVGLSNKLLVHPLQLLYAYTSIFNGGYLFASEAKIKRKVGVSQDAVKILKKGMRDSAVYGTSYQAQQRVGIEKIFSKTGTAPYCLNSNYDFTRTHAWFIGFYPFSNPTLAVLVFLIDGTGSKDAAKIGGEVINGFINIKKGRGGLLAAQTCLEVRTCSGRKTPQQVEASGNLVEAQICLGKRSQQVEDTGKLSGLSYISDWLFSTTELETHNLKFINELNPFSEWEILPAGKIKFRWGILPGKLKTKGNIIPTFRAVATQFNQCSTRAVIDTLIEGIMERLLKNANGIELDIEADWKAGKVVDEDVLLCFLQRLKTRLNRYGYPISLCVEREMIYRWKPDTWSQIDKLVAQYKLLLYDYNKNTKVACAGAPVPQIREDVRRFLQLVPHPEKVILGVPTHGFFWAGQKDGSYQYQGPVWYSKGLPFPKLSKFPVISYIEGMKGQSCELQIIPATKKIINWDDYSMTPYIAFYRDNKRYEIWYEDVDSLRYKIKEIVLPFNLKGIALWRFGMEDTKIW